MRSGLSKRSLRGLIFLLTIRERKGRVSAKFECEEGGRLDLIKKDALDS